MEDITAVFKALADPNRLKALCALEDGRLCACQIIELLDLAPSTVSRHMDVVLGAGLIKATKKQRWVYYELEGKDTPEPARQTLKLLHDLFRNRDEMQVVKEEIKKIKAIGPEEICRKRAR